MGNRRELDALDPTASNLSSNKVDLLTPHKITVVILVQQYLKTKQSAAETGFCYPAQSRRKFCMVLLKLIQFPDFSYKDLHNMLTSSIYKIHSAHLEGFEKCMSNLIVLGIENLFDLFDMQNVMDKILSENSGVSQYGVVGLYIRRVAVTLDRMSFPEMMALYNSIKLYYEKGIRSLAICPSSSSAIENSSIDVQAIHKDRNSLSKWSIKQAELFIFQQSSLLESNELRALSPIEMQSRLKEIIDDNPLFSQAHFLSYMNYLRLRDFYSSLDAIHRTFDRNPVQTLSPAETRGFQYSSLNLAILHTQFNHKLEALASLKECIMLAQQAGDRHCLDHANAWYCILNSHNIRPNEKCIPDESDLAMILPTSLSIQFVVKIAALCGYKPSKIFEVLLKSDDLNCRNSILELAVSSIAERTAVWSLYGKSDQASLYSQLLLKLNKTWALGDVGNSESICQVLCTLALWLSNQGEYALSAVVLHHARTRYPRDLLARNWMICDCYITITQAIHKCKWQEGIQTCCQLHILDKNASILQRASLYIARRNLSVAQKMLNTLLLLQSLEPLTHVRALILLSYSMMTQYHISSQVVNILSKASTYAKEKYLEYEVAIIDMILAHVLLYMKIPQKALEVIQSCVECIYSNGGIYDKAKATMVLVKCLVASAQSNGEKLHRMSDSKDMINQAIDNFKKLEAHSKVKDVYMFLTTFYNDVELFCERNKYAFKFKQYDNEFPTPIQYSNVFF